VSSAEIVREVERETAVEVAAILAAADRRAAEIVETARKAVRARVDTAVARAEPGVRAEAGRRVNEARLRIGERRVELEVARSSAVHAAAAERLGAIVRATGANRDRWAASLVRLTREALELAGPNATIRVRDADAATIRRHVEELGGRLEPIVGDGPDGIVAVSQDGRIEVDARIPARLERARTRLAEALAGSIGLGG
jgi:vacuolar-type H+-ATPase subunit E/Vma4